MDIILASSSPRRKELLSYLGYDFSIIPADINENMLDQEDPKSYVKRISEEKGRVVFLTNPNKIIISADTTVVLDGIIFGKPVDKLDSRRMISMLSGKSHKVYTAFSVFRSNLGSPITKMVETVVTFKTLTNKEIDSYVDSEEGLDKAGSYGFQEKGMALIFKIEGSPSNVIGLPLVELSEVLNTIIK